jgi:hypothetical protein
VAYIFGNVPLLGNVSVQIHEDAQVICQYLGKPTVVDAVVLGSYAHRLQWKWTNLAHGPSISTALHLFIFSNGRHVDHI